MIGESIKLTIDDMLADAWSSSSGEPPFIQISLGNYRTLSMSQSLDNGARDGFLKETADLPDLVVVCIGEDGPSLVTDDKGHPLEFV